MTTFINYEQLKQSVSMEQILSYYNLLPKMKKTGDQLKGKCPFHDDKHPSLSVNLAKNCWQCFGCKLHGNILDFVKESEGFEDINEAALFIAEMFGVSDTEKATKPLVKKKKEDIQLYSSTAEPEENKPLGFVLKNLDPKHPYLIKRVSEEAIKHFGLGYCAKGMMKNRVAIPVHNKKGELIGYAGRWTDPETIEEEEEKYKLPFKKSLEVYNLSRQSPKTKHLIVIEGFFPVYHFYDHSVTNVVSLMGSSTSEEQEELLIKHVGKDGYLTFVFDGDEAGYNAIEKVIPKVAQRVFTKAVRLEEGRQPDDLSEEEINAIASIRTPL